MKRFLVIVFALAVAAAFATFSFAAMEKSAVPSKPAVALEIIHGKVVSIDKARNEIVVKDNKTGIDKAVIVASGIISSLKTGEEVKVTLKAGSNTAEKVKIVTTLKKK